MDRQSSAPVWQGGREGGIRVRAEEAAEGW